MIKRLLLFGFVAAVLLLLRRIARSFSRRHHTGSVGRDSAPTAGGQLVRDRVCNTFVPKDSALSLSEAGRVHFFCSQECRQRYLDGSNGSSSASAMAS